MKPNPTPQDTTAWLRHQAQAEADALQDDGFIARVMAAAAAQDQASMVTEHPSPKRARVDGSFAHWTAAWSLYPLALALAVMGGLAVSMLAGVAGETLVDQTSPWSDTESFMSWVAGLVLSAWCAWAVWNAWRHGSLASAAAPAP
jgi:hypothetical protein